MWFLDVFQTGSLTLKEQLNVEVTSPFTSFGFTVASIGDISGDGYENTAVGAPLEGQLSNGSSFGSIYVFSGDKNKTKSSFSQVGALLGMGLLLETGKGLCFCSTRLRGRT